MSLSVEKGQVFGLLGPNGSGKTTTLGILLGAIRADGGSYSWFGQRPTGRQRRRIGALLEQPCFYPWLSGSANLRVFAAVKGISNEVADRQLDVVGLSSARDQSFQTYSLGMKQRLGLAAALMGKPEVLVLDEPTNGVDAQGIVDIRTIINDFAAQGGTVILASHLLDEVEKVCTDVAILKDGVVLKIGPTRSILATSGWIEVAASDLAKVEQAVRELFPSARVERRDERVEIHAANVKPEDVNARLAARGMVLSHLVERQPSLESQYLNIIGGSPT